MPRKTFLSLFAVLFCAQLGVGIVAPLMHVFAERTGASALWMGIMFSAFALSRVVFMPLMGRLSDVRDRKKFVVWGLAAYAVISLMYTLPVGIQPLTIVRLLQGLASTMVNPVVMAYVGDFAPKGKEGTHMSIFQMSSFLGTGFGPFLGGFLTSVFYLEAAFYAMAGLSTIALLMFVVFVPSVPPSHRSAKSRPPVLSLLRDSRIKAMSIYHSSRGFWRQGIIAFLPIFAVPVMQMSEADVGLLLTIYMLTGGFSQGLMGRMADRVNRTALMAICGTIAAGLLYLLPTARSGTTMLAILLPIAVLSAAARISMVAMSVDAGRDRSAMGAVMGLMESSFSAGMIFGPMAYGYFTDHFGVGSAFQMGATAGVIGSILSTYFMLSGSRRPHRDGVETTSNPP
ncbi:MAG: MFS transporter [Chloroflexi bacterium]|nr:MFS transporter [Chloroflexota bacterium]